MRERGDAARVADPCDDLGQRAASRLRNAPPCRGRGICGRRRRCRATWPPGAAHRLRQMRAGRQPRIAPPPRRAARRPADQGRQDAAQIRRMRACRRSACDSSRLRSTGQCRVDPQAQHMNGSESARRPRSPRPARSGCRLGAAAAAACLEPRRWCRDRSAPAPLCRRLRRAQSSSAGVNEPSEQFEWVCRSNCLGSSASCRSRRTAREPDRLHLLARQHHEALRRVRNRHWCNRRYKCAAAAACRARPSPAGIRQRPRSRPGTAPPPASRCPGRCGLRPRAHRAPRRQAHIGAAQAARHHHQQINISALMGRSLPWKSRANTPHTG